MVVQFDVRVGCCALITQMETEQMAEQIKELFEEGDTESIKFILGGETQQSLHLLCSKLPESMAIRLRTIYQEIEKERTGEEEVYEDDPDEDAEGEGSRNRRIDNYLQGQLREEQEQRNQSFLQMIAKMNQKLIYEQHFGFPFFDLIKRVLLTHGDPRPQPQTIKAVHSQVQIFYGELFSKQSLQWLSQNHPNLNHALKEYLAAIFPTLTEKYYQFHQVYRNIKKQTLERPKVTQQQEQEEADDGQVGEEEEGQGEKGGEIAIQHDQTLGMDEKLFLVSIADSAEQFQTFQKNRTYNFLCFGLRKYQAYIGLGPTVFGQIKERQFCELLSFLSIRFIRRMVFEVIRERNGGKLAPLTEPITPQEVRRVGNAVVDEVGQLVRRHMTPLMTLAEGRGETIFLEEFQPYKYRDFIPRKAFSAVRQEGESLAQYVWRTCKQYKHIWAQRVKVDHFLKQGGMRPQTDFLQFAQKRKQAYLQNPGSIWKEYLMIKFGFVGVKECFSGNKRLKLDSCAD